ncbi:hypothetical protein Hanom_Chr01g00039361 [Helianthus anomalus]
MHYSVEEFINEDVMTYGPKTDESSISSKSIESKRPTPSTNFVSKGMFDPYNSFACADKVVDSKCGPNVLGKTDDGSVESLNNKSDGECFSVNACDCDISNLSVDDSVTGEVPQDTFSETTGTPQENQERPDSSSESVSVGVPNVESSGTPLETVAESKSQVDSHDTCVDEISTCSKIKTESESINEEKGS